MQQKKKLNKNKIIEWYRKMLKSNIVVVCTNNTYEYFILIRSLMYLHVDYLLMYVVDVEFDEQVVVQHHHHLLPLHDLLNWLIYQLNVVEQQEQLLLVVAFEF
jgi:hypothetical protein